MKNVIDLFTREKYDPADFVDDLPVFKGTIHFEEVGNLDFANTLVQVAMQLPERSKRNFLKGLGKMSEVGDAALSGDQKKVLQLILLEYQQ